MDALDGAGRSAPLFGFVFTVEIFHRVIFQWGSGIAALLRAPVHESLFADVEVPRARAAAPLVRFALGYAVLKPIQACVIFVDKLLHLMKDILFFVAVQRLQSFSI